MTALADILKSRIAATGPLSVADYMGECLLHPDHGYYATRDPLGAAGDFTTAPEISQMFGEMVGLALAQCWLDQGSPKHIALAELGPGRGTLMADILRVCRAVPEFLDACAVHLVEASPVLKDRQASILAEHDIVWHDTLQTVPDDLPLYLVANEFFDALPIRQFVRDTDGWRERQVGVSEDALSFGASQAAPIGQLDHRLDDTRPDDLVETCAVAAHICADIGRRIQANGGCALIFDYGDWRSLGDTLQALKAHAPIDPLSAPGESDLTAHVDFEALVASVPCQYSRLTPQGVVLERLGITQRAQKLAGGLSGTALDAHISAHRRLTHPDEMGTVFKSLALFPKGTPPPPGYET